MINLSDFQPLSIAKIKKFSSTTEFLQKIFSDKVHAILIEEVTIQTMLRDGASFRRLKSRIIGLKYLHQSLLKFRSKYSHINLQCLSVKANL